MTISDYKEELVKHAPCKEGAMAFDKCKSRKDVFELIGQPVACDFFMKSLEEGWGPSPEDFESIFRPYINGALTIKYHIGERKLHSQIWCNADEISIDNSVRWLILVGCNGEINIKDWQVVKIFIDKNSNVELKCGANSIVYVSNFGGKFKDISGNCRFKI